MDLLKDTRSVDTGSVHSSTTPRSLKRRSSYDGRISEMIDTNGCIYNLNDSRGSMDRAMVKYQEGQQTKNHTPLFPPFDRLHLRLSSKRRKSAKQNRGSKRKPHVPDIVVNQSDDDSLSTNPMDSDLLLNYGSIDTEKDTPILVEIDSCPTSRDLNLSKDGCWERRSASLKGRPFIQESMEESMV